jgi:hypothetical protein
MTILHRANVPDHGKADHVYVTDMVCTECGKTLEAGDAFTIQDDGFKKRGEYVPCTEE